MNSPNSKRPVVILLTLLKVMELRQGRRCLKPQNANVSIDLSDRPLFPLEFDGRVSLHVLKTSGHCPLRVLPYHRVTAARCADEPCFVGQEDEAVRASQLSPVKCGATDIFRVYPKCLNTSAKGLQRCSLGFEVYFCSMKHLKEFLCTHL